MNKILDGRKIIGYDFEVFSKSVHPETGKAYWMVVFIERESGKKFTIKNDVEKLRWFYDNYKNCIFVGYNSRHYDQYIFKGLLLGMDAGHINDMIIEKGIGGYQVVPEAYKIPFYNYDCQVAMNSLKQLEAFMGSMIKESDVPFNIDRPLTVEEELETEEYCTHDVLETLKVFEQTINGFNAQVGLLDMFNLDVKFISKTNAQLTAEILGGKKLKGLKDHHDFKYPDTLVLNKYTEIKDFFDSLKNDTFVPTKFKSGKPVLELELEVAGVPTVYARGGLHGSLNNFTYEGKIYSLDVQSLYPSLMIEYGLMSRAVDSDEKFKNIKAERVVLKKAKNPLQESLKLVLNY